MPAWPASLPQALQLSGFSGTFGHGAIRTDMDAGPSFQRQRYTAAPEPFSGSITIDREQYATLVAFWRDDLGFGALSFDWVHPITAKPATVQFNASQPPKISAQSGQWFTVSLNIEVLP